MAASTWRSLYTINGGTPLTLSYTIASSESWSVGSVVAWNSAGALFENTTDSTDNLGLSLETVTSGAGTGPNTTLCAVHPFTYGTVYAVKETLALGTPAVTDIGTIRDLDIDATNGWGIHTAGSGGSTPNFRVVDIDTTKNEWHVVIAPQDITDVFQFIDAAV